GPVVAPTKEALARGDRDSGGPADVRERLRVARVDLDPEDVEGLDRAGDLQEPFRLEVEVEVHEDVDVGTDTLAERRELVAERLDDGALGVQLGESRTATREARRVEVGVGSRPRMKTLVLSAVKPRSTTSRPAFTTSSSVRSGGICISLGPLEAIGPAV